MLCKAIKSSPYYAFAWNALAWALMNQSQDKYYKAQTASEKAIDLLPYYAGYLQKNGIEFPLQYSKEYNQSLAYFRMTKGRSLSKQSKLPEALNDYEEAIRLDPGLAYAWYLKSEALKELKGKKKEAEDAYNEAINLNPSLAWSSKSEAYIDLPCEEEDACEDHD